eukprot:CAMPEP_0113515246 /NCGR_PEP_ID=MMETSP0014_2-20120614/40838_1 /TAXON_ID=2857 /ORGANISM="Nitzschia sp." /LENGTH=163 /DNA_ID=CAMNT_0000411793 /DNA_START=1104 /DNA_END=1595 /DNA_ORIENTATION=+ /assembly_acc=CAM_ASM_000159
MVTRGQANRTANDNPQPGGGGVAGGGPGGGDGGIDDDTLMVDADAMPPAMDEAIRALTAIGFSAATRDILLDVAKEGLKPKDLSIMRDEEAHSLVVRLVKMKVANMEPLPMKSKSDAHYTLDEFLHRYGAPQCLVSDNAKELTQGEFAKKCREAKVPVDVTVE